MALSSEILDCTLRDGSYVNNFSFTKKNTKDICSVLEKSGINFIEVGHGIGLGASKKTKFKAIESDEDYILAAKEGTQRSKIGVFAIPGIANKSDILNAKKNGIDFIRIGVDAHNYKDAFDFINTSKELGLFTCVNFMKSYAMKPKNFAKISSETFNNGADIVYIVDSAGGMKPTDIENYYKFLIKKNKKLQLGFHGHNNIGLAIQNSLLASDLKFHFIDSSLQGIGRSLGNASTEILAYHLSSKNKKKYDYQKLLEYSEKKIRPFAMKGYSSIDILCGIYKFHSSYLPVIEKFSKIYKIDPRILIKEITKITKVDAKEQDVKKIAKKLKKNKKNKGNWKTIYNHFYINEQNL